MGSTVKDGGASIHWVLVFVKAWCAGVVRRETGRKAESPHQRTAVSKAIGCPPTMAEELSKTNSAVRFSRR